MDLDANRNNVIFTLIMWMTKKLIKYYSNNPFIRSAAVNICPFLVFKFISFFQIIKLLIFFFIFPNYFLVIFRLEHIFWWKQCLSIEKQMYTHFSEPIDPLPRSESRKSTHNSQ